MEKKRMGWDALKARGSSANCLSCCSCNLSSQRKPNLMGFHEIYQGWQGNLEMETLGPWVPEVAVLDLSLKNGEGE